MDVWWRALKKYDLAAVIDAFGRYLVNPDCGRYPPKPGDIVRMLTGSTQDSAAVAWSTVDRAVREVGPYQDVVFDDRTIHRVLYDMGGWQAVNKRASVDKEWVFVGREFETRYRGYVGSAVRFDYPPVLVGISNAENALSGFSAAPPVLIGRADDCVAVMNNGVNGSLLERTVLSSRLLSMEITDVKNGGADAT